MYDVFFDDLTIYASKLGLFSSTIKGIADSQLQEIEKDIEKSIPDAIRSWYRKAGIYSGDWQMHDQNFTVNDLNETQQIATGLTQDVNCKWKLTDNVLPFSSILGERFWFVYLDMGSDPPVYCYTEGKAYPNRVGICFSTFIREWILSIIEQKRNSFWLKTHSYEQDTQLRQFMDAEISIMRIKFIERIHAIDLARRHITSPTDFQFEWLEELQASVFAKYFFQENVRVPWSWAIPYNESWNYQIK